MHTHSTLLLVCPSVLKDRKVKSLHFSNSLAPGNLNMISSLPISCALVWAGSCLWDEALTSDWPLNAFPSSACTHGGASVVGPSHQQGSSEGTAGADLASAAWLGEGSSGSWISRQHTVCSQSQQFYRDLRTPPTFLSVAGAPLAGQFFPTGLGDSPGCPNHILLCQPLRNLGKTKCLYLILVWLK